MRSKETLEQMFRDIGLTTDDDWKRIRQLEDYLNQTMPEKQETFIRLSATTQQKSSKQNAELE